MKSLRTWIALLILSAAATCGHARYFDAVAKRFISEDPIAVAGGLNFHSYVEGNPIDYVDPDGLTKKNPKDIGKPAPLQITGGARPINPSQDLVARLTGSGGRKGGPQCPPGYRLDKDPPFYPHGQKVFTDGKNFITPDADGHIGGVWKVFDRRGNRLGTYDADMKKIGK